MAVAPSTWALILALYSFGMANASRVPTAMFVFGDSLVDVGMNNRLVSIAKANFKPNGIDYPGHRPTGRFCNGRIISDFLSEHWGMEPTLAYDDPNATPQDLLRGANFASAGAGILNDTGAIFIQRFRMSQQVELFRQYVGNITKLVGEADASRLLSGGLFAITIGANDYLSNYFLPGSPRKRHYTLPDYEALLISELRQQIKSIYDLGARIIVVSSLGPLGCIPLLIGQRFLIAKGKCIESFQEAAMSFNRLLRSLAEELQQELPSSTMLYSNGFDMVLELINNPAEFGFQNVNTACCGRGPNKGLVPCNPTDPVCDDRSAYIFWDPFHPTEAVNKLVAQWVLFGPPSDISPVNLSQLFS